MSKKTFVIALACAGICAASSMSIQAKESDEAQLAKSLSTAGVSLDQGLRSSVAQGKPISGRFEINSNGAQLTVYLTQGGKFSEVILDRQSGFIKTARTITDTGDLKAANAQSQAMKKAKVPLDKAVRDSVTANPGYLAASVMPTLRANRPIAEIVLMNGTETRKVFKPLD
jgi:hypothetical protein